MRRASTARRKRPTSPPVSCQRETFPTCSSVAFAPICRKRGGGIEALSLDEGLVYSEERSGQLVELDSALEKLATTDERVSKVIELRFFGGLSVDETAAVLRVSPRTVKCEWMFGRAWLRSELNLEGVNATGAVG